MFASNQLQITKRQREFWDKINTVCDEFEMDLVAVISASQQGIFPQIAVVDRPEMPKPPVTKVEKKK